ncbi:MAG: hypothetical protein FJ291_21520 [Planctomycetes bacterium]|nr:hypothetical protein [Planctomycetota bacterium]
MSRRALGAGPQFHLRKDGARAIICPVRRPAREGRAEGQWSLSQRSKKKAMYYVLMGALLVGLIVLYFVVKKKQQG